ncbi:MAG: exonuclease SbcCD subunit D [Lachnospiraceae bacterium]|nr:exonuclease SbcCD subunit D [Lachnospiraceae bacterium]
MKFMHLADLHLGKRVNEFSMLEDQKYVLEQVLKLLDEERADALLIAGDIYDRQIPPIEAVRLFDFFLTRVAERHIQVYLISGNHDSIERVSFGARLMESSGIHMATEYDGTVDFVTVEDEYGVIDIYLLPFLKPAQVRAVWGEEAEQIRTYQEALAFVMSKLTRNMEHRSILLAHQFVAGAAVCDSEEHAVGGLDQVEVSCFDGFDYVALGHLHGAQCAGRDVVRYAGTLLKYSFSEVSHKKSVTMVELKEKGNVEIYSRPITPLHEMRDIRGSYEQVTKRSNYENTDTRDYVRITLTDEEDIFDAVGKLRVIYPNLMRLEYDNMRTRQHQSVKVPEQEEEKTPFTLLEELFVLQNNKPMSKEQGAYMQEMIRRVWEDETI